MGLPLVFTIIVVNFIGGYIPYIGAFLGGGLAVIIALGDGGLAEAILMLVIVLAANLVLENFVEPKVMGRTLDIHPLVVLVVTALGGLLGGIVGLILAVPAWVIASNAISRCALQGGLRAGGRTSATRGATHARLTNFDSRTSTDEREGHFDDEDLQQMARDGPAARGRSGGRVGDARRRGVVEHFGEAMGGRRVLGRADVRHGRRRDDQRLEGVGLARRARPRKRRAGCSPR